MEIFPVLLIGTGPEARIGLEILTQNGVLVYGILSMEKTEIAEINDVPVVGKPEDKEMKKLISGRKIDHAILIQDVSRRKAIHKVVSSETDRAPMNIIAGSARVSPFATLGFGNLVQHLTLIQPNATVGTLNLFGSNAVIEPMAEVGDCCTIGSNVVVGSGAVIEDEVYIGNGSIISPGITIGKGAAIAPGSVVLKSVKAKATVFGNPAVETKG